MSRPTNGPISLTAPVHRALVVELIAHAPAAVADDVVDAICARIRADEMTERGHPSLVERARRLLKAFEGSVHLAPIIYDALSTRALRAFLVLALDRFAIDGAPADISEVTRACERFVDAVRNPAVDAVSAERL